MSIVVERLSGQIFDFSKDKLSNIVGTPLLSNRLNVLENNEYKVIYSENISISGSTTGSITFPQGSRLDETLLGEDGNCILWQIDGSGNIIEEVPKDSNNQFINSSLDSDGNWVVTNTSPANVIIVFILITNAIDYQNLVITKVISYVNEGNGGINGLNLDNDFSIINVDDNTKELFFSLSGLTSGNTVTLQIPDKNGTLALLDDVSPAGNNTEIQFNNNGEFGSSSGFTYNGFILQVDASAIFLGSILSSQDIEINDTTKGIIMTTPDLTKRFRLTINNTGNLVTTEI